MAERCAHDASVVTKPGNATLAYPYYVLAILSIITVLNYYDRGVIAIVLQPMKSALNLTDTQIGLLSGLAFSVVYSLLGVPIARIADRGHRVTVLGAALAVWSLMTAACGFAGTVTTMFAARLGVGVGEAGGVPTTHALVADYFSGERRSSALSVIAIATALGGILGLFVGGLVSEHYGWRAVFWVGGAPGLLFACLAWLTVREPRRRLAQIGALLLAPISPVPLGVAVRMLWRRPSYGLVMTGLTIAYIGFYALQTWTPTYFIRTFHLSPGQIGPTYALLTGVPQLIGMLIGGVIVDRWILKDRRAPVWILIGTFSLTIPLSLTIYLAHDLKVALAAAVLNALVSGVFVGPTYALIQGLAGHKIRATAVAIFMLVLNLVSLSLGPVVAGYVSDRLAAIVGNDSLRWSLCAMLLAYAVSLPFFVLSAGRVRADLDDAALD